MPHSSPGITRGAPASRLTGLVAADQIREHWRQAVSGALGADAWTRYARDFDELAHVTALRHPAPQIFLTAAGARAAVTIAQLFEADRASSRRTTAKARPYQGVAR